VRKEHDAQREAQEESRIRSGTVIGHDETPVLVKRDWFAG
jgi:hypothetical protein